MSRTPASVLYEAAGNALKIVTDGADYLLAVAAKLRNAAGTIINPATEDKQDSAITKLTSLDGKDFATQTTLSTLATEAKLELVRALLETIDADTSVLAGVDFATQTTLAAFKAAFDARDLATQTTLAAVLVDTGQIEALLTTIDVDTSNLDVLLSTRATEATLLSADGRLTTIDAVLDSIKDTDGIKKITDELPAGTQDIGSVRLRDILGNGINSVLNNAIRRLEARSSITSPDGASDVAVVTDNSINRLETRTAIVGQVEGAGSEVKATIIADTEESAQKRLQTEARIAPGSTVNIGTGIPANPADLVLQFLEDGTSSEDMLVNGSGTPVNFDFGADPTDELSIEQLLLVFAADDFEFDGASFGPNIALTNGIEVQTIINSITTTIFTIKQNEDFLRIPGRPPIVNNTGPKDILAAAFGFGGVVKLAAGSSDKIRVRVQDNLTSVKFKYLTGTVYAVKEGA